MCNTHSGQWIWMVDIQQCYYSENLHHLPFEALSNKRLIFLSLVLSHRSVHLLE